MGESCTAGPPVRAGQGVVVSKADLHRPAACRRSWALPGKGAVTKGLGCCRRRLAHEAACGERRCTPPRSKRWPAQPPLVALAAAPLPALPTTSGTAPQACAGADGSTSAAPDWHTPAAAFRCSYGASKCRLRGRPRAKQPGRQRGCRVETHNARKLQRVDCHCKSDGRTKLSKERKIRSLQAAPSSKPG